MKWGLICKPQARRALNLSSDVYDSLKEQGDVYPDENIAQHLNVKGYSLKEINKRCDIVVTLGGDGTILMALAYVEKPIFAINSGAMGFLAEIESKYIQSGLQQVIKGNYNVEERYKLNITVNYKRLCDATNEVTVQTAKIAKILYLQLFVDDELIETMGADGVIIATPTGSTSYSLSVGGPLMDPSVNAMIIAPLAAFKLSARPWIVPLDKTVRIKILPKSKETKLVIDGQHALSVTSESDIRITVSEKKARFIRFGESFYQMVRLKLVR
jgi:NAD+ kinase